MGRSVEDEGEAHKGDGTFVSLSNSDADMAGENVKFGVERLVDECLSEEEWTLLLKSGSKSEG